MRTAAGWKLLHQQNQKWTSQKPRWQHFLEEGNSEEARSFGTGTKKRRGKIITTEEQKKLFTEDWQHLAAYVTQKKDQNTNTPCLEIHHYWEEEWNESETARAPSRSV